VHKRAFCTRKRAPVLSQMDPEKEALILAARDAAIEEENLGVPSPQTVIQTVLEEWKVAKNNCIFENHVCNVARCEIVPFPIVVYMYETSQGARAFHYHTPMCVDQSLEIHDLRNCCRAANIPGAWLCTQSTNMHICEHPEYDGETSHDLFTARDDPFVEIGDKGESRTCTISKRTLSGNIISNTPMPTYEDDRVANTMRDARHTYSVGGTMRSSGCASSRYDEKEAPHILALAGVPSRTESYPGFYNGNIKRPHGLSAHAGGRKKKRTQDAQRSVVLPNDILRGDFGAYVPLWVLPNPHDMTANEALAVRHHSLIAYAISTLFGERRRADDAIQTTKQSAVLHQKMSRYMVTGAAVDGGLTLRNIRRHLERHSNRGNVCGLSGWFVPTPNDIIGHCTKEMMEVLQRMYILKIMLLWRTVMYRTPSGFAVRKQLVGVNGMERAALAGEFSVNMNAARAALACRVGGNTFTFPAFIIPALKVLREGITVQEGVVHNAPADPGGENDLLTPRLTSPGGRVSRILAGMVYSTPSFGFSSTFSPLQETSHGTAFATPIPSGAQRLRAPMTPVVDSDTTATLSASPAIRQNSARGTHCVLLEPDALLAKFIPNDLYFQRLGLADARNREVYTAIKMSIINAVQTTSTVALEELMFDIEADVDPWVQSGARGEPPWMRELVYRSIHGSFLQQSL